MKSACKYNCTLLIASVPLVEVLGRDEVLVLSVFTRLHTGFRLCAIDSLLVIVLHTV